MEAYETPVMEVVEIEDELITIGDCVGTGTENGGSPGNGYGIDSSRPVNKESL
jgi:hypothetical protein